MNTIGIELSSNWTITLTDQANKYIHCYNNYSELVRLPDDIKKLIETGGIKDGEGNDYPAMLHAEISMLDVRDENAESDLCDKIFNDMHNHDNTAFIHFGDTEAVTIEYVAQKLRVLKHGGSGLARFLLDGWND